MTNKIKMTLKNGDVVIEMLPQIAPKHVARITELVKSGFYNGLTFHRVIDGFMAQTGSRVAMAVAAAEKISLQNFRVKHLHVARWGWRVHRHQIRQIHNSLSALQIAHFWTVNIHCGVVLSMVWNSLMQLNVATK